MNSWRGYIFGGLIGAGVAIAVGVSISEMLWPRTNNPWWYSVFSYGIGIFFGYQGAVYGNKIDHIFKVKNGN